MKESNKKQGGIISPTEMKSPSVKVIYGLMVLFLIILVTICIFPSLWVIMSSLKNVDEIYAIPPTIFPKNVTFDNIKEVWQKYKFVQYYINTLIVTVGMIAFSILSNGLAGYVIAKLKPIGYKKIQNLIFASMMIPMSLSIVPVYRNITNFPIFGFSMINTYWPMIIMAGANAFMVMVYINFFRGIPTSLIEAARLDGCGEMRCFVNVVLPLSKPIIFTAIILGFNTAWGDFFWPYLVLKDKSVYTVMVEVYNLRNIAMDTRMAILAFTIVPPIILFCFFSKYIMNGFTMSGIKG